MQKHDAIKVFTPATPARLAFIEREEVNDKIVNALRTPGKQIVVYGHSGSGKTTLLVNKLHQTYSNHITTQCTRGMTFDQAVLNAFDQLGLFYEKEKTAKNSEKITPALEAEYLGIKFSLAGEKCSEDEVKQERVLPPQLTAQNLAKLIGAASCCWVIEDFHKMDAQEKARMSQVMKVFADTGDSYPCAKVIAVGAVGTAREVVEYDAELKNRVSEIHVPLMSHPEIRSIIDQGSKLLNLTVEKSVGSTIVQYSNGLPAVCHQLCLNLCFASGLVETQESPVHLDETVFQKALQRYVQEASDSLKSLFEAALNERKRRFDNGKLILLALANCSPDGARSYEILERVRQIEPAYPSGNLSKYLKELQEERRGALIKYDYNSGMYSYADPIYRVYALVSLKTSQRPQRGGAVPREIMTAPTVQKIMKELMEEIRNLSEKQNGNGNTASPTAPAA